MKTDRDILELEKSNPCPFGLVRVSEDEISVAAKTLQRASGWLFTENSARNLAYSVLVSIRSKHFEWWRAAE